MLYGLAYWDTKVEYSRDVILRWNSGKNRKDINRTRNSRGSLKIATIEDRILEC